MGRMNKKETVCSILRDMGFVPDFQDGIIRFKYEMKNIVVFNCDDSEDPEAQEEDNYMSVVFPCFYDLAEDEIEEAFIVCNKANRELRQIKTCVSPDLKDISSTFEFWFNDEEDIRNGISNSLRMFSCVRPFVYHEFSTIKEQVAEKPGQIEDTPPPTDGNEEE